MKAVGLSTDCDNKMKDSNNLTIAQLKDILRNKSLASTGDKADLIARLDEVCPEGTWMDEAREINPNPNHTEVQDGPPINTHAGGRDSNPTDRRSLEQVSEIDLLRREMELMRRERDLLQRELEFTQREAHRDSPSQRSSGSAKSSRQASI